MNHNGKKDISIACGVGGVLTAGIVIGSCIDRRTQQAPAVEEVVEEEYDHRVVTLTPTNYANLRESLSETTPPITFTGKDSLYQTGGLETRFEGNALYVGSASNGRNRTLVSYDWSELEGVTAEDVERAELVFTIDGTCWSSYDNQVCDRPLPLQAFLAHEPWDPSLNAWHNFMWSGGASAGEPTEVSVPRRQYELVRLDATAGVKELLSGAPNHGFIVKAVDSGELTGWAQTDAALMRPPVLGVYLKE